MKKINIQHEANIKAEGKLNSGNCDAVIILENGMTFTSQTDLAEYLGVTPAAVSATICGRQRTCKGYHLVSVARLADGMDVLLTRLRETAAVEADAKKWQAHQAEQEAIRKAEEKRQAEIAKLQAKLANLNEKCNEYETKWHNTIDAIVAVEKELEALGVVVDNEEAA